MGNPSQPLIICNAKVLTPFRSLDHGVVIAKERLLAYIGPQSKTSFPKKAYVIDAQGLYVAPGFIDIHVHGGGGGDTLDASLSSFRKITMTHAAGGTTSLLLTTLTAPLSQIKDALEIVEIVRSTEPKGAKILGVHLEGPYINPDYAGAQNPEFIREPRKEEYLPILKRYPCIRRVTFAPELPGGLELARELKNRRIVASIGHSGASYREVLAAIEAGCTHVTHMFSAMSGTKRIKGYRITGLIESTLLLDELTTELIADGHHLPPSLLKLVVKVKGFDKISLVTDAMAATGLGPGSYTLGGLKVLVERDTPEEFEQVPTINSYVAKVENRSSFAGSVATMNQLVYNMIHLADIPLLNAVKMATVNPARVLGVHDIGVLRSGTKADVVLFDENFTIMMTIVEGRIVYQNSEFQLGSRNLLVET